MVALALLVSASVGALTWTVLETSQFEVVKVSEVGSNDRAVFVLAGVTVTVPVGAVCRRIVYLPPGVSPSVIDSACGYTCTPMPSAIDWLQVTAVPSSRELQLWAPQPM